MINYDLRPIILGQYILQNNSTIRKTAMQYGVSKSTVHLDVSKRLKFIDNDLYLKVKKILNKNYCERNIRGGIATKLRYEKLNKNKYINKRC